MALRFSVGKQARFRGWHIVGLMFGPRAAGTGVYVLGGTIFVIPLEESLGLQRGVSSLLFAAGFMVTGIAAPASGALIDRYGPRIVLLASVLISAGGYLLFATSTNTVMVFVFYVGVISPVILNVAFNASAAFINNWFDRYKATSMSLQQIGAGLGAIVLLPLLALVIDIWDWRVAAIVAAGIVVALGLPAALFSRNTPEEVGLLPDGAPATASAAPSVMSGFSAKEALRTPTFWFITAGGLTFGAAQAGLQIHFVPVMVWKGLDQVEGALVLAVMAIASVPMVLVMRWLGDRLGRLTVAGITSVLIGAAVIILNLGGPTWTVWGAALLMAPNFGIYPLLWAAVGQAFGRRTFSTIRGMVMLIQIPGTMGMPVMAGFIFDETNSYATALWIIAALWAATAALLFFAPQRTYVESNAAAALDG